MQKTCTKCSESFQISDEDQKFYEKVSPVFNGKKYLIPSPTLCPDCRQQRKLSFRNERNLYKRKCDLCKKDIIAIYSPDKPYIIYCNDCWWSDKWDPMDYAQDFDFSKSFNEQFNKLILSTPQIATFNVNCVNSDYVNIEYSDKNCYMLCAGAWSQDCYYGYYILRSKDCVDCTNINNCELSYELIDCKDCYQCKNSIKLEGCLNCDFSYDLVSCKNCFGSYNLIRKEYCFFNQQMTKEDYIKARQDFISKNDIRLSKTDIY